MGWMCQSSQSTVVIILGQRDIFCLTNRKISTKCNIYTVYTDKKKLLDFCCCCFTLNCSQIK